MSEKDLLERGQKCPELVGSINQFRKREFQLFCCQATNIPVFPALSESFATQLKWTLEDPIKAEKRDEY